MTFVVTEACVRCKYTDCVDVCPVECFHEGPEFLVINPAGCIDCGVCVPECPAEAIYAEDDLPEDQRAFIDINAQLARQWPVISASRDPLEEADRWVAVKDKRQYLDIAEKV
ncbi:ferredoxin FdxA [Methyloversatilis thermotolerans]|jgi:ferredoxin|uniref:ferredoxin FdxA n=1 Tax=Methyloversatilis thermotolerans TaxID=1346290 RepID=UPI00036A54BB|nr:ferredoxin FdxA [Methyloversatilis thermotolerans]